MEHFGLECRMVSPDWKQPLADFFQELLTDAKVRYFHPHPLTVEEAEIRSQYKGKDLYYVLVQGNKVLGYGMLRGWDEGYQIPSLGIALHSSVRGMGLGNSFMHFLHAAAKLAGAKKVRLKVYADNLSAINLYKKLGYIFQPEEAGQLVGILDL